MTQDRLGVYLPVEHIDNPRYNIRCPRCHLIAGADALQGVRREGRRRSDIQSKGLDLCHSRLAICLCHLQLRPPVDQRELEIDSRTGMKVSTKVPADRMGTDLLAFRITWPLKIAAGTHPLHSSAAPSASASRKVATLGVGRGLNFGNRIGFWDRVSIPSRTSPPTATGPRLLCVSLVTTKSSVMSATMVGVIYEDLNLGRLTFSSGSVYVDSPNGRVPPIVTGTFGGADFLHSLLGETTE